MGGMRSKSIQSEPGDVVIFLASVQGLAQIQHDLVEVIDPDNAEAGVLEIQDHIQHADHDHRIARLCNQ